MTGNNVSVSCRFQPPTASPKNLNTILELQNKTALCNSMIISIVSCGRNTKGRFNIMFHFSLSTG